MTDATASLCPFCSMGCTLRILPGDGNAYVGESGIPGLDYDSGGACNRGSLCSKGNMALELLTHPRRLQAPQIRQDGRLRPIGWDAVLDRIADGLQAIRAEHGARAIGFYLGPRLSCEEATLAAQLARSLGSPNVDGGDPEDLILLDGIERSPARPRPVENIAQLEAMTSMLLVGDLFSLAPCLARPVLHARYDRRQNQLATLSGVPNRTAWFGKPDLRCHPAGEVAALALLLRRVVQDSKDELPWMAALRQTLEQIDVAWLEQHAGLGSAQVAGFVDGLTAAPHSAVLIGATFGDTERPDLAAGLAALLAEATGSRFLALTQGANVRGVNGALRGCGYPDADGLTAPQMLEAVLTGDLRALLVLGCDPLAALPGVLPATALAGLDLLVTSAALPGETAACAHIVLPGATWGEKTGRVINAFGAGLELAPAMPPPGAARSEAWLLQALAARLPPGPAPAIRPPGAHRRVEAGFFTELGLFFRKERRENGALATGSHLLLPAASPAQAGDGCLTRHLSWPRHETRDADCVLSAGHAAALGVRSGDRVRLRSPAAEAVLVARIEPRLPDSIVLAPPHEPAVRQLMRWQLDPVRRDLELTPCRVSVEPLGVGS